MGFRCSWVASRGQTVAAILDHFQLAPTGEPREDAHAELSLVRDCRGWTVVIAAGAREIMQLIRPRDARELSTCGGALWFRCDDTAMCTELRFYAGGALRWMLDYASSWEAPTVIGEPEPEQAEVIEVVTREAVEDQSGPEETFQGFRTDYLYSITRDVAFRLTGFAHDGQLDIVDERPFVALRRG